MWFPQQFPCRHTLSPLSPSEYDASGKTRCQVGLSWQVVGSDLLVQAMSLKNNLCERDQAKQLEVSRAPDNEKRTVSTLQQGTAMCGQQVWSSIPMECSSEGRTSLFLLEECQHCQDQLQCSLQLLLPIGKTWGPSGRIIGTEYFNNLYKLGVMEEIPQAVVGDGFKHLCQTGRGSRDAVSGRKLIGDKQPKIFGVDSILEQLVAHFSLESCKLGSDGLSILVCKNDSFTLFKSSSSCRQE